MLRRGEQDVEHRRSPRSRGRCRGPGPRSGVRAQPFRRVNITSPARLVAPHPDCSSAKGHVHLRFLTPRRAGHPIRARLTNISFLKKNCRMHSCYDVQHKLVEEEKKVDKLSYPGSGNILPAERSPPGLRKEHSNWFARIGSRRHLYVRMLPLRE